MENNMEMYISLQKENGIKIKEIVEKAGVGRTTFFDISKGKQVPKIDTAAMIANALDASVDDVFPILKGEFKHDKNKEKNS